MTTNRDKSVEEIRQIRREHYEETKDMTSEECRQRDRNEIEAFRSLFGKIGTMCQETKNVK